MDKVELKVNVINQLKLLRQSTFKDTLCFLDEDIQNAQRAKATEVKITVNRQHNQVVIENNGKVLNNPQALFSIAESEWDDDIKQQENPFGMGFFSNITVSDLIEIHTGNKYITFDVAKMINTNDTTIKVKEIEEYYNGFKLILNNFNFSMIYSWNIQQRVEILGKYVHALDIYYNDELQEKKDLTSGDNSKFQFTISEDSDFKGWLALKDTYSYDNKVLIFYKGRLVSKLDDLPYLKGDIHISDKTLNLTAPDRKDIIKDSKLSNFIILLKLYVQDYCNKLLFDGKSDIKDYASCISYYIDKKQVKNNIKFMTFKGNENNDIEYLHGIALVRLKNKSVDSFDSYELFLKNEAHKQSESMFSEIVVNPKLQSEPRKAKGTVVHSSSRSYHDGYTESPHINQEELIEQRRAVILNNSEPVFYIAFDEIEQFEYKLNIIKHYNLKVIISRNDVESSILESMKDSDNVLHISDLEENIEVVGNISNTTLSLKEQRALMIFNMISEILGFNYNIFSIGDLMVTRTISVKSINKSETIIDSSVIVLKDTLAKKIYVDRSIINKKQLREDINTDFDVSDYKFVLSNFKLIVSQISKLGFMEVHVCEEKILDALGNSSF